MMDSAGLRAKKARSPQKTRDQLALFEAVRNSGRTSVALPSYDVVDAIGARLRSRRASKPQELGEELNRLAEVVRALEDPIPADIEEVFIAVCAAFFCRWFYLFAVKARRHDAEDLAADAMGEILPRLKKRFPEWVRKSEPGQAAGYVYRCAMRAWVSEIRPTRRGQLAASLTNDGLDQIEARQPRVANLVGQETTVLAYEVQLLQLGHSRRDRILISSLPNKVKAEKLKISEGRASVLAKEARARLAARLGNSA